MKRITDIELYKSIYTKLISESYDPYRYYNQQHTNNLVVDKTLKNLDNVIAELFLNYYKNPSTINYIKTFVNANKNIFIPDYILLDFCYDNGASAIDFLNVDVDLLQKNTYPNKPEGIIQLDPEYEKSNPKYAYSKITPIHIILYTLFYVCLQNHYDMPDDWKGLNWKEQKALKNFTNPGNTAHFILILSDNNLITDDDYHKMIDALLYNGGIQKIINTIIQLYPESRNLKPLFLENTIDNTIGNTNRIKKYITQEYLAIDQSLNNLDNVIAELLLNQDQSVLQAFVNVNKNTIITDEALYKFCEENPEAPDFLDININVLREMLMPGDMNHLRPDDEEEVKDLMDAGKTYSNNTPIDIVLFCLFHDCLNNPDLAAEKGIDFYMDILLNNNKITSEEYDNMVDELLDTKLQELIDTIIQLYPKADLLMF